MTFVKYFFIVIGVLFLSLVAVGIFKTDYQSKASIEIEAPKDQVFAVYNNPLLFLLDHTHKDSVQMQYLMKEKI